MAIGSFKNGALLVSLPDADGEGETTVQIRPVIPIEGEGEGILGLIPAGQGAVGSLTDGQAIVVQALGRSVLTVISESGATATVSRVDSLDAESHTTGSQNQFEVAAENRTATNVDWPYYRISAASGTVRWSLT